jgi:hypothetical protein
MTEIPILFNAWSIRRILAGDKTQTRRVVKPQPPLIADWAPASPELVNCGFDNATGMGYASYEGGAFKRFRCPYGQPDDKLWVRETHHIDWYPSKIPDAHGNLGIVHYRADTDIVSQSWDGHWCPSIHMPRWASRITLENQGVRVERVQDISIEDIRAEGIEKQFDWVSYDMVIAFQELWDSINAKPKRAKRNPYTGEPEDCYVGYPWENKRTEHTLPNGRIEYIVGNPHVWAVMFSLLEVR